MKKKISENLLELLQFFPKIDPPVTISEDVIVSFSAQNKPLPQKIIQETFSKWDQMDEFTELVPCFSLDTEADFHAIVYWKGSLLSYEYIIVTLDDEGHSISKKVIAGTLSNGQTVKRSVATIDEDLCIYSVVGESLVSQKNYNPTHSNAFKFELLPDGTISSQQEENILWAEKANPEVKN